LDKHEIQLSLRYMNEQVLPLLDDKTKFSEISSNELYELGKTILSFENQEESMEKFKDRVIECVNMENIGELISGIIKEPVVFKSSPAIRALCEYRRNWLENQIRQKAEFSWHMPDALFPKYPQVESFLRSDQISMDIVGRFEDFHQARRFANALNNQVPNGFSIKSAPKGWEGNVYVSITKTRDYYEKQAKLCPKFIQELQDITHFID
jgi:hypothetical protein